MKKLIASTILQITLMRFNIFPISVHCWGGFGSQLFAFSLAEQIKKEFPNRNIRIVFHSSGVTKRELELKLPPKIYQIIIVDDYNNSNRKLNKKGNASHNRFLNNVVRRVLKFIGLLAEANTDAEVAALKPWVTEIRGHYSHRLIPDNILFKLLFVLTFSAKTKLPREGYLKNIALHYRLGDLLDLSEKGYIPAEEILNLINKNKKDWGINVIDIFSDSLNDALSMLSGLMLNPKLNDPTETICESLNYKYFIGTNSKLTIWIVLFRLLLDPGSYNTVPLRLKTEFDFMLNSLSDYPNLRYF